MPCCGAEKVAMRLRFPLSLLSITFYMYLRCWGHGGGGDTRCFMFVILLVGELLNLDLYVIHSYFWGILFLYYFRRIQFRAEKFVFKTLKIFVMFSWFPIGLGIQLYTLDLLLFSHAVILECIVLPFHCSVKFGHLSNFQKAILNPTVVEYSLFLNLELYI